MRGRQPSIYRKNSGLYVVKWGGKEHSLSTNLATAEKIFLDPAGAHSGALVHWVAWRHSRQEKQERTAASPHLRVAEIVEAFLDDYERAGRHETASYYRTSLRRFTNMLGRLSVHQFRISGFDAFRQQIGELGLAPKTISHELKAIKTLWKWAAAREMCQMIDFSGIKMPRVPRSRPEPIEAAAIAAIVAKLTAADPNLACWVAINYLCACRPSEVARIAAGQGVLRSIPPRGGAASIPHGYLELAEHKTEHSTNASRLVLISPEALVYVRTIRPLAPTRKTSRSAGVKLSVRQLQNEYAKRLRAAGQAALAHKLRDSAATHLLEAGVDPATTSLLLGHAPKGEWARYGRPDLHILREKVGLLSLRSTAQARGGS